MLPRGRLPEARNLQQYVDDRINRFTSELDPAQFDTANEVIRARLVELKNFKILVDGLVTNCGGSQP